MQQMYWKNIDIQKCHKMLYRNKFLMKNDQEILKSHHFQWQKKSITKNIENFSVDKWKLLVYDIKGEITVCTGEISYCYKALESPRFM